MSLLFSYKTSEARRCNINGMERIESSRIIRKRRSAMKVSQACQSLLDYHRMTSKKSTLRNYEYLLKGFSTQFGDREPCSLTSEEILSFLSHFAEGAKQSTNRLRFSLLRAFFTFIINSGMIGSRILVICLYSENSSRTSDPSPGRSWKRRP